MSEQTSNLISITIDGQEISVEPGTLVIRAAEQLGITIPRFCEHPLLDPVAACRQCLVDVEGARKPEAACALAARPGLVVRTQHTSEFAAQMQADVMELILVNHPLDCPQCDKGGECPLQDQALKHGHPDTRMAERKSTHAKAMPISPLIKLDRERCVLCARCTRFSKQISGDAFIELMERGALEQVGIYEDQPYESYFSGNVTQICPVGALTATTYRFGARPFDIKRMPGIGYHDASGSNIRADVRRGVIQRVMARTNLSVNDAWIDDATRFGFAFIQSDERLVSPLAKVGDTLSATTWKETIQDVATLLNQTPSERIGVLAGDLITDEDAYAVSRFARDVLGTDNVDFRAIPTQEELVELPTLLGVEQATNADIDGASCVVVTGIEPHEENPALFLRLRKHWRKRGLKIVVIGPVLGRLAEIAWQWIPTDAGEERDVLYTLADGSDQRLAPVFDGMGDNLVVLAGERIAQSPGAFKAARHLAGVKNGRFAWIPRHAGTRGALEAGLLPGVLPGGRPLTEPGPVAQMWSRVPTKTGKDTRQMLEAAANGELDVLFLVGADPMVSVGDPELVAKALNTATVITTGVLRNTSVLASSYVFPAAAPTERVGSYTNWEGRRQSWPQVTGAVGSVLPEWDIVRQLSKAMDRDLGWQTANDVRREAAVLMGDTSAAAPSAATGSSPTDTSTGQGLKSIVVHQLLEPQALLTDAHELLAAGPGARIWIHPQDAKDISDGQAVRVSCPTGTVPLTATITEAIKPNHVVIARSALADLGSGWRKVTVSGSKES
ncbi:NADH-quinone oxidoreductase subunit NuoG [Stomatohabitans albus]|uniref:NADH-quinone oxidoreductase subunit NuoG n=1 Tax=Stomatohabitans albus TaxID=3110766 RepID=UPI00300C8569